MYVLRRQNIVTQYISTRTTLEICLSEEKQTGARVLIRWWKQAGLDQGQVHMGTGMETEEEG